MRLRFCLLAALLIAAPAILAHHYTTAYYDQTRLITVRGVVAKLEWSNPHSLLYFDVKDKNGALTHWASQLPSPAALSDKGWTKDCLKPGDEIIVIGNPAVINELVLQLRSVKNLATKMVYYRDPPGTPGEVEDAFQQPGP